MHPLYYIPVLPIANNVAVVRLLLENEADVNAQSGSYGNALRVA